MKIHYIITALVFFACSCEDGRVTGIVVLDNKETVSASDLPLIVPPTLPLNDSVNSSASETVVPKPKLLIQPPKLLAQPPKLLIQPPKLIVDNPVVDNTKDSSLNQPQILPVATLVEATDKDSITDDKLNLCAHTPCPLIYCKNNLPPIPSQGICCQRCVTNPKCNTTACPKYKCGTYLIPANLTAGECCDRCAPATVQSTKTSKRSQKPTKTTSEPKKHADKHKKARSSSSSEEEDNSRSSSSEQINGKTPGCNIRRFNPKQNRSHSRLIHLLTEALAHLRHSHSRRRHDESSEAQEN